MQFITFWEVYNTCGGSWGIVVGTVSSIWAESTQYRIPACVKTFIFIRGFRTGSAAHALSHSVGTRFLSLQQSGQNVNLTSHLHLVPRLRMSRTVNLLPLYALESWTGRT